MLLSKLRLICDELMLSEQSRKYVTPEKLAKKICDMFHNTTKNNAVREAKLQCIKTLVNSEIFKDAGIMTYFFLFDPKGQLNII